MMGGLHNTNAVYLAVLVSEKSPNVVYVRSHHSATALALQWNYKSPWWGFYVLTALMGSTCEGVDGWCAR